jgi:hypothetical protein
VAVTGQGKCAARQKKKRRNFAIKNEEAEAIRGAGQKESKSVGGFILSGSILFIYSSKL